MQSFLNDEKNRISLKAYARFFALGEEAKEKDHVKIKPIKIKKLFRQLSTILNNIEHF